MNRIVGMRKVAIVFMFVVLLISGLGIEVCSKDITIGGSLMDTWEPFYNELEAGWRAAAEEFGVKLIVTSAECDLAKQISQTEDFIAQEVDAIILIPADTVGIVPAVKLANKAGIPVFTADNSSEGGEVVSHVASDNYNMGVLAAEYIGERMKGKGKVALLSATYITSNYLRGQGLRETFEKKYPNMEIIREINVGFARDKSLSSTEDILAAFPKISGEEIAIFGLSGGDAGMGAYMAVKSSQRDDVFVVTVDGIPETRELLFNGDKILVADVFQFAYDIGYRSLEAAVDYLSGKDVPKTRPVDVKLVITKDLVKIDDKILVKGVETD